MKTWRLVALFAMLLTLACSEKSAPKAPSDETPTGTSDWVGTWAAGPQLTETNNLPPAPGLSGNTLRQIVFSSIGGTKLRLQLSNAYGTAPLVLRAVHVAASTGGSAIDAATDTALTFDGATEISIPAGQERFSDAFTYELGALQKLAISVAFADVPAAVTGHPGSRTTSYIASGDAVATATFPAAASTDHWYFISGLDVLATGPAAAVVTLGDSITDGRGSTTNQNDRWPDHFSRRLRENAATSAVSVLNLGIGGNAVLAGGLGPTALSRFERDVLGQRGARWLIVLEGVNDIGNSADPAVAERLIAAYETFIDGAHEKDMLAYGVPILPFGGSQYASDAHEAARQAVNDWIRSSGRFDAVIDLDAAVRDPAAPNQLLSAYDSGDHLHLSPAGYAAMANAIDLALFER